MLELPCLLWDRDRRCRDLIPSSCPIENKFGGGEAEQHQLILLFLCELPADLICI